MVSTTSLRPPACHSAGCPPPVPRPPLPPRPFYRRAQTVRRASPRPRPGRPDEPGPGPAIGHASCGPAAEKWADAPGCIKAGAGRRRWSGGDRGTECTPVTRSPPPPRSLGALYPLLLLPDRLYSRIKLGVSPW